MAFEPAGPGHPERATGYPAPHGAGWLLGGCARLLTIMARTLKILLVLLAFLWVLEAIDVYLLDEALDAHGIRPRSLSGLLGILWAPFLHAGFGHLAANSVPLVVLAFLLSLEGRGEWVESTVVITVLGGAFVWLLGGANEVHLGASLLIFGYAGDLLARGFRSRSLRGLLSGLFVLLAYGGSLLGGLVPRAEVSLLGHLGGLLAGLLVGWLAAGPGGSKPSPR